MNHDVKDLKSILIQFVFTISETHEHVHVHKISSTGKCQGVLKLILFT